MNNNQRFAGMDILKCLITFFVVYIHCPVNTQLGQYVKSITMIAVPIFFMITGYYYEHICRNGNECGQIKKIFRIMLFSNILYFLWDLALAGEKSVKYLISLLDFRVVLKFVIFNVSPFWGHLWYLNAILYVLLIMYFVKNKKAVYIMECMIPILLMTDLIFGKYSMLVFGREFPYIIVRNFCFVGIPYFLIGKIINRNKAMIINKKSTIKYVSLFVIGVCVILVERFMLIYNNLDVTRNHYIGTTISAVALFVVFLSYYKKKESLNRIEKIMCIIGREYSLYVYIIHPIIIRVISALSNRLNVMNAYDYFGAIIVFITSICVAYVVRVLYNKYRFLLKRNGELTSEG